MLGVCMYAHLYSDMYIGMRPQTGLNMTVRMHGALAGNSRCICICGGLMVLLTVCNRVCNCIRGRPSARMYASLPDGMHVCMYVCLPVCMSG